MGMKELVMALKSYNSCCIAMRPTASTCSPWRNPSSPTLSKAAKVERLFAHEHKSSQALHRAARFDLTMESVSTRCATERGDRLLRMTSAARSMYRTLRRCGDYEEGVGGSGTRCEQWAKRTDIAFQRNGGRHCAASHPEYGQQALHHCCRAG